MQRRLVKVDKTHVAESQRLLDCLGVPWIAAPGEAEAQCAVLVKEGLVFGTATEDMDALTFGTPILLRHLTYSEARKMPVLEFKLDKLLKDLNVTMDQFIDICILCGCDYIPSIRGIGPKTALRLIREYGNIETLLENLDKTKYSVPDGFLFEQARELFRQPDVNNDKTQLNSKLKWGDCNKQALIDFLVKEKGFSLDRVESAVKRINKCKGKASQRRVDSFFKVSSVTTSTTKQKKIKEKQLEQERQAKLKAKKSAKNKKGKTKTRRKSKASSKKSKTKTGPYANIDLSNNNNTTKTKTKNKNKSKSKTKTKKSAKKSTKKTKKTKAKTDDTTKNKARNEENTGDNSNCNSNSNSNNNDNDNTGTLNNNGNSNSSNDNTKQIIGQKRKREDFMNDNDGDDESEMEDIDVMVDGVIPSKKDENSKKNESLKDVKNDNNDNNNECKTEEENSETDLLNNEKENNILPDINSVSLGDKNNKNNESNGNGNEILQDKENNKSLINCNDNEEKSNFEAQSPMKAKNILKRLNGDNENVDESESEELQGFDVDMGKEKKFELLDESDHEQQESKQMISNNDDDDDGFAPPPRKRQKLSTVDN